MSQKQRNSQQSAQEYLEKQDTCGIEKGDFVRIKRQAESYEAGWQNDWTSEMTRMVGKDGVVVGIKDEKGVKVIVPGISRETMGLPLPSAFPFFALKKLKVIEPKY